MRTLRIVRRTIARCLRRRASRLALALLAVAPAVAPAQAPAHAPKDSLRVLFIGNSYTYFNNLPRLVQAMAEGDPGAGPIATRMVAPGGMTLKGHLAGTDALRAIGSGHWDFVVLQEQSALANPIMHGNEPEPGAPDAFFAGARALDSAVRAHSARTVFYETWSRVGQPQHTATISGAYRRIAHELGSILAPVGDAFAIVRTERPASALNIDDKSHPTPTGSYVAAAVLYQTLTGRVPAQGAPRVVGHAVSMEGVTALADSALLVAMRPEDARYYHDVARRAIRAGAKSP